MVRKWGSSILVAGSLLGFWGCSDSDGPTSATPMPPGGLASDVLAAMAEALDDEYQAETIYERVLADFGDVLPFFNVVRAEQRHSAVIARLYENRGMEAPSSQWSLDDVPRFGTIRAACEGAVEAETRNIEMYDRLLERSLPQDVALVFSNNRRASLENHLPAFRLCAGS